MALKSICEQEVGGEIQNEIKKTLNLVSKPSYMYTLLKLRKCTYTTQWRWQFLLTIEFLCEVAPFSKHV